jgi:hypothetical protein
MGICTDSATTYLRRLGYNAVRHPREGIQPLDLIGKQDGEIKYLGGLDQLITNAPGPLPTITRDQVAADIQGQTSSKLDLAIGLTVLQSVLASLGGNVGVKAGYKSTRTIQFVFSKVLTDSVRPLDVGRYLKAGVVDEDNLILQQYVLGNGHLFVLTRTVKTNKFTVQAESAKGVPASLDVPAIQGVASGNLTIDTSANAGGTVSYEGAKNLVFGFECFEVGVVDGMLSLTSAKSGAVALSDDAPHAVASSLLSDGALVDLR